MFRRNQKLLYGLLMQVSAAAVKELCAQKRYLGALPGMLRCSTPGTADWTITPMSTC